MNNKGLFFFIPILFLFVFCSLAQQQMGLYPLSQYSVGQSSDMELRTTAIVQDDTLKIPYIEDFSGPGLPIDSISVDQYTTDTLVYRITHLKMHALKSHDSIRIFNAVSDGTPDGILASDYINGMKYVKVIDKYTFQLFKNKALTHPDTVTSTRVRLLNWSYLGTEGYSTSPDTLGFLNNNGGVFINNDMALNPVSIGVATFDGVNYKGIPYSTTPTKGYADNLTSLPFNLSKYGTKDSIYMSFFWQSKSLGDSPISSEFLSLEFRDSTTTTEKWVQVWKQFGATETADTFKMAIVPITDSAYLHKAFQYRFRSYGVLNGRFNVWNLDYIYIDSGRTKKDSLGKDITIVSTSRSVLKNYTAIPYKHIKDLPVAAIAAETNDGFMLIRDNTFPSITNSIDYYHTTRDNLGNSIKFKTYPEVPPSKHYTIPFIDTIPGTLMTKPYVLKEEFTFAISDTTERFDMSFNNFAAIETYFYDYYAYDDNTPEIGFLSVNPGGTKIANGYKILKEDYLTHIDYCFIKNNGVDLTNSAIILSVWKKEDLQTKPQINTMYSQQIAIAYSTNINGFVRYALTTPLHLDSGSTYYFGYIQNFNNALFLGYDKNNDHLDKMFFCNDGNNWQPFTDITSVPGSLMIRPVFSDGEIITATDDKRIPQDQFTFYPNPATSELHFTGEPEYISIYDISGRLLLEQKIEDADVLSTETLTNGLYLIILSKGDYKEVKRLIIQK